MKPFLVRKQSAYEATQEALGRREKPESASSITVREGSGMACLPSWFAFWWHQDVIKPVPGEIQRRLYGVK